MSTAYIDSLSLVGMTPRAFTGRVLAQGYKWLYKVKGDKIRIDRRIEVASFEVEQDQGEGRT